MALYAISDKIDPFINTYLYNKRQNVMKPIYFHNSTWNVTKYDIWGKHEEKRNIISL